MATSHKISIDGKTIHARRGEVLLDAALKNGIDLPYDCRSGHCGTCCVKLTGGQVEGGQGAQPGIIHPCQSRVIADIAIETSEQPGVKTIRGAVKSLRNLSPEVVEVQITTDQALPHLPGQYAHLQFKGFPVRPYSLTHPLSGQLEGRSLCFHVRRIQGGRISSALGKTIAPGHKLTVTGPFGSAYFRPNLENRMILVSTATGFAPIWSIMASALHENPQRMIMLIAGGGSLDALYMGPALGRLMKFPNVRVLPVCSAPQNVFKAVRQGRPTDFLPRLYASDVVYACGLPAMVESVKDIAARAGAVCYADPFIPAADKEVVKKSPRALSWLTLPNFPMARRKPLRPALPAPAARLKASPARSRAVG